MTFDLDYGALASSEVAMAAFKTSLAETFITNVQRLWGVPLTDANGVLQLDRVKVRRAIRP